jgi:hypothetical protein
MGDERQIYQALPLLARGSFIGVERNWTPTELDGRPGYGVVVGPRDDRRDAARDGGRDSWRSAAIVVAVAMVLAATGCARSTEAPSADGPAGDTALGAAFAPKSPAAPAPTSADQAPAGARAAYLQQGNAVCKDIAQQYAVLSEHRLANQTTDKQFLHDADDLITGEVARLRALPPPAGDEATVADLLAKAQQQVADDQQATTAFADGSMGRYQDAAGKERTDAATANRAFNAYGLTECGKPYAE